MHFRFTTCGLFALCGLTTAQTSIKVDPSTRHQLIDGFGVSQAFNRAKEFELADATARDKALTYLFDTESGAGFSIIRNRIGSGGSGDSIEPNNPGSPSSPPTYSWNNDDKGQVWFTGEAVKRGVKTIYADAWGSPGFMKTSGEDSQPGFLCGTPGHQCSSGDWRQAYAQFLVKYVQLYNSAGYSITHLGFLNEPDFKTSYSQMQISDNAAEAIDFIPILSNALSSANLDVEITCCDATGWNKQKQYTTALVNAGSTKYLGKITTHSYSSDAQSPDGSTTLRKWNTEAGDGSESFTTTWYSTGKKNEGFIWAQKLADAIVNADFSAYVYWEGFEVKQPQSASHLLDALDGTTVTPSGIYWAFSMWSRYIRPGASRLGTSGSVSNVIIGAFQNLDNSIVVVFTNSGDVDQTFNLSLADNSAKHVAAYVTNSHNNFAQLQVTSTGGTTRVTVPSKGVVTVRLT